MFRFTTRLFVVAAVVLSLTVLSVPAAQAHPLAKRTAPVRLDTSWFQAALSWIAALVPTQGHRGTAQQTVSVKGSSDTGLGSVRTNTGSCIDPLGLGRCDV